VSFRGGERRELVIFSSGYSDKVLSAIGAPSYLGPISGCMQETRIVSGLVNVVHLPLPISFNFACSPEQLRICPLNWVFLPLNEGAIEEKSHVRAATVNLQSWKSLKSALVIHVFYTSQQRIRGSHRQLT
jgi:hypothetical protein